MIVNNDIEKVLLQIQSLLLEKKYEEAVQLYRLLEENWGFYSKSITSQEKLDRLLRIVHYIDFLLKEKKEKFLEKKNYLKIIETYSKY